MSYVAALASFIFVYLVNSVRFLYLSNAHLTKINSHSIVINEYRMCPKHIKMNRDVQVVLVFENATWLTSFCLKINVLFVPFPSFSSFLSCIF